MKPDLEQAKELSEENSQLRHRLEEAEQALQAIRTGDVDALVTPGEHGDEICLIRGAEHSYRIIFETMQEAVALVAWDGMILYGNARLGSLLKQPMKKLIGAKIQPFVVPSDLPGLERLLFQGSRGISKGEITLQCSDQSSVAVQLSLSPLNLHGVQGICLVASDISGIKQTEESLLKSEERFRLLIEDIHDYAIIALNEHGRVESWNLGAERIQGYLAEEILGRHFSCFFPLEDSQQGKADTALAITREHGRFEEELWLMRKDGNLFWADITVTALQNQQGHLIGFSMVIRDSTQQREAKEALRLSEELFHSAVDFFPGGFAIYDAQKRFRFVNRQVLTLSGLSQEQFTGRTTSEIFSPEMIAHFLPALDRCVERREPQSVESSLAIPSGSFYLVINLVPILDQNGELLRVLVIGFDITARRRAEEQVQMALKKEVVLRREIQHRVKNSIQIISSLLFLQARELTDPKMIEVLRESQERARSIALVYSMLSQRKEISRIEFGEYAQQLIGALSSAYEIKREMVSFHIHANQILLDLDTSVPCGLIVTELVSNALKYAFEPGSRGDIYITLEPAGPADLMLTIKDNGVGLPRGFDLENQPSLGLRLVRDLTLQLGGKIEFQVDHGTIFRVRFPRSGNETM